MMFYFASLATPSLCDYGQESQNQILGQDSNETGVRPFLSHKYQRGNPHQIMILSNRQIQGRTHKVDRYVGQKAQYIIGTIFQA